MGNREVIAAGSSYYPYNSVEKYNVQEDSWTFGLGLPFELYTADSIPYGDSFVLVGGFKIDTFIDAILLYNDDSWVVTEGALKTAKGFVTAINVRRNIFPDC